MKALVLAAGLGLRMRPLSLLRAKPVLPVLNRPLIHWTLDLLARHGVSEVIVNLHHLPATVVRAVGSGSRHGLRVRYSREPRILGTGGGARRVRRFFGKEPALLVNGDAFFDFDLTGLVERHRRTGAVATLALKANPDPERYGPVITDRRGRVRSLPGCLRAVPGTVSLFTGIHVIDPAILDRLPPGPSDTVRHLYAPLVREGDPVVGVRVRGPWYDLSSPSLYLASHMSLLARGWGGAGPAGLVHPQAQVHPGAQVVRSAIGAGCVVREGAKVVRSVLWERVTVGRGARVYQSVLADRTVVRDGERVDRSVLIPAGRPTRRAVDPVRVEIDDL